ncbi:hypothetical protein vBAcePPAc_0183 [Aeromonas phage vB_AceP_PAc]|nr:hypothetical protein vBAcePPAc_0183 [Aeromonas phage vB_AceP_PAc]
MKNWNKTKEDIKSEYKMNVKQMACRFYYDKRNDNNTLLNDLYDRIEKEGGDLQFVSDVSDYIDTLRDYDNRPYYG